jgi:hypothetical protein
MVWLSHYGKLLTSLKIEEFGLVQQQLPCTNLLELRMLFGCTVQLGPGGLHMGVLHCCTKLTLLELRCSIFDAHAGRIDCLSSLVHLQHLVVFPANMPIPLMLSSATLPSLKHLTYFLARDLSIDHLTQFSGLTSLRELNLDAYSDMAVGPSSVPGLVFPASLTKLELLSDVEAGLLSLVPPGLQELRVWGGVEGPADGPDSLFACMAGLQRLSRLSALCLVPVPGLHWPPPGPAYSALTANTNLVQLELLGTNCPQGVWQYVFPAAHKLPHLAYLELQDADGVDASAPAPVWSAVDINRLVTCCPSLSDIVNLSLQPGLHVSALQQLTALTRMEVFYNANDHAVFSESVRGLAAISQLKVLDVKQVSLAFKLASLLPLTSLTALTDLRVYWYPHDDHSWPPPALSLWYNTAQVNHSR